MKQLLALLLSVTSLIAFGQVPTVELVSSGNKTSIRGMSVPNDNVVWVSGSRGMVGRSTNGGKDWKWMTVKGFETRDFRDIEAFDGATAIIMAVDTTAYLLRTIDGGESWTIVYENNRPGMFMDALEFWNEDAGIVIGDPIDGKIFVARTFDGGKSWKELPENYKPAADSGEAFFAASGTNVRALDLDEAVFVSGGLSSNIFIRGVKTKLPILQGSASRGANSIAVWDNKKRNGGNKMMVVGGDYAADSVSTANCFYTNNRGRSWQAPVQPPHGYKSCVEYLTEKQVVACGTSGVDYSADGGKTWRQISKESFHVVRRAKNGKAMYLAGNGGRVAKLVAASSR